MDNLKSKAAFFNVLSLEDSDFDFEIIKEQLIKAGYNLKITRAEGEQEFRALIQSNRHDLILADYNLPQFDAFEALKICQEYCPDIPFICVSGTIGETKAIELLKNGATDYVLKDRLERLPFAIERALKEAIEQKEKKQVEQSLLISEEKYRTIFENVQDVFYQADMEGMILEISPSIKNISDLNREDLLGRSVYELYADPKEREMFLKRIKEKGEIRDYEIKFKTKNGDIKQTSVNASLVYNSEGRPHHIDGTLRDITERKLAEQIIRQSEAELNYAQRIAKMGSWVLKIQTNEDIWSQNMFEMFGYKSIDNKITYADFLKGVHPDDLYLVEFNTHKIMSTKSGVSYDFRYILPDGQIMWVQSIIIPVFENGELTELHGVKLDITEKKAAEQELIKAKENAEASDRLKTAFMNNVSHEVRTPLNGILGFGQILADPDFPAEEKEKYYRMLNNSCDRLLNTLTNFMDIALLTSGNQKIQKKEILLEQLIDDVMEKYREICQAKQLTLILKKPQPLYDYKINTDVVLLGKILHQLIDNAVKFTSHGQITVGFKKGENEAHFFVKDTGIGISEDYKKQIFGDFLQEDNADTRQYQGTGIGLSIAKGLIELLGGHIWVESEKGKGTTFYFSLPSVTKKQDYRQNKMEQNH